MIKISIISTRPGQNSGIYIYIYITNKSEMFVFERMGCKAKQYRKHEKVHGDLMPHFHATCLDLLEYRDNKLIEYRNMLGVSHRTIQIYSICLVKLLCNHIGPYSIVK